MSLRQDIFRTELLGNDLKRERVKTISIRFAVLCQFEIWFLSSMNYFKEFDSFPLKLDGWAGVWQSIDWYCFTWHQQTQSNQTLDCSTLNIAHFWYCMIFPPCYENAVHKLNWKLSGLKKLSKHVSVHMKYWCAEDKLLGM